MAEFAGIIYDETDCQLFCWHVAEIVTGLETIRAEQGDGYADEYTAALCEVISGGRAGGRALRAVPDPPVSTHGRRRPAL